MLSRGSPLVLYSYMPKNGMTVSKHIMSGSHIVLFDLLFILIAFACFYDYSAKLHSFLDLYRNFQVILSFVGHFKVATIISFVFFY